MTVRRFYEKNEKARWVNAGLSIAGGVGGLVAAGPTLGVVLAVATAAGSYWLTPVVAREVRDVVKRGG